MPSDDVIVPKYVEERIRALHPPDQHADRMEEARTHYRVLREDRKKVLADARQHDQIDPPPVRPTAVQQAAIEARRRKRAPRRRKVLVYPQPGSAKRPPVSTHEQGLWAKHLRYKASAEASEARRGVSKSKDRRVLVTGSRHWADEAAVHSRLDKVGKRKNLTVIEGGAKGADVAAASWAKSRGAVHEPYKADWKAHGRAAGPIRNKRMLVEGRPDLVLAFHEDAGSSKGTKHMLKEAKRAGVPSVLYGTGGKPVRRREMRRMGLSKAVGAELDAMLTPDQLKRQQALRAKRTKFDAEIRTAYTERKHQLKQIPNNWSPDDLRPVAQLNTRETFRRLEEANRRNDKAAKEKWRELKNVHTSQQRKKLIRTAVHRNMEVNDEIRARDYARIAAAKANNERVKKLKAAGKWKEPPSLSMKGKPHVRRNSPWQNAKGEMLAKADYASQLRMEAESRRASSRWAAQHPEWVSQHERLSERTEKEVKAALKAGRKKVPKEKLLVPIRADRGTAPRPEKRRKKLRWLWQR